MNRSARVHKSTKIPNVKLRPAQRGLGSAAESSSSSSKRSRRRDELLNNREDAAHFRHLRDDGHDHGAHFDADFTGTAVHPLKGAIISITGLSDSKATLTQYARELGARVEGNLTEDVTHLVADRPGSEKYRFALELGMHIVSPDWILEIRDAWLTGEDVDAEDLEQHHQLPALSNTTICFSAVAGAERRRLVALATELGATVSDELRFDGSITHLVSATSDASASGSVQHLLHFLDRSRHGRNGSREQAASRILAVRPEWLDDCQKAQGCLSEQTYSIFVQLPDQDERSALINKVRTKLPSPFIRQQEPIPVPLQSPFIASSRSKLALAESVRESDASHADDADDDQPITIGSRRKAAAAGDKSFDSILSQLRSNQTTSSTAINDSVESHADVPSLLQAAAPPASTALSSINVSTLPSAQGPSSSSAVIPRPNSHRNGLLGMSRASSFSPVPPASTVAALAMRKTSANVVTLPQSGGSASTRDKPRTPRQPCFHDKSFKIRWNDPQRRKVLETVLQSNGAALLTLDSPTSPDFVLVEPHTSASAVKELVDSDEVPVLHYWIEYCLHHEVYVEPTDYFAALPALVPLPLPEGGQLRLLLLGFEADTPELYHAEQFVTDMGGSVAKQIKGEALTHVVCASRESLTGRLAQRARSSGLPVVGLEFFIKARQSGRILPPPIPIVVSEPSSSASTPAASSTSTSLPSNADHIQDQNQDEADKKPDLPLAGCTISRSKALAPQGVLLERKVLQLGACWQAQVNGDTTHLLHRGVGQSRESKELDRFAFIVHPNWLDKCLDEGIRVDESLFPASLNPAKSLITVLSNSDGSASGNFLSQASQSANYRTPLSQDTHGSQQTQTGLAIASKPWNRSISADAVNHGVPNSFIDEGEPGDRRRARGQSEATVAAHIGHGSITDDPDCDADVTLSGQADGNVGMDCDDELPAPSSQTLFEGEEPEADEPIRDVRGALPLEEDLMHSKKQAHAFTTVEDQMRSADELIERLQSGQLGKGDRKRGRAAPRARKQRSDEQKLGAGTTDGKLPPEEILEKQARLDELRAADARANGYSLGMDKYETLASASQINQSLEVSGKVVWNDSFALTEQKKLLNLLKNKKQAASAVDDPENQPDAEGHGEEATEDGQMEDVVIAGKADSSRKRGAEDTFGAGRTGRHSWENRKSESPKKRPVVRRQPLARRAD